MERRKRERRRNEDTRDDVIDMLKKAKALVAKDHRHRHFAERIQGVLDDIVDTTVTIEKRGRERREITPPRMLRFRVAGA